MTGVCITRQSRCYQYKIGVPKILISPRVATTQLNILIPVSTRVCVTSLRTRVCIVSPGTGVCLTSLNTGVCVASLSAGECVTSLSTGVCVARVCVTSLSTEVCVSVRVHWGMCYQSEY